MGGAADAFGRSAAWFAVAAVAGGATVTAFAWRTRDASPGAQDGI